MHNLIVTDVFGKTNAIEKLASEFSAPTAVLDPYDAKDMFFKHEQEAYEYFGAEVGLNLYAEKLIRQIQLCPDKLNLIGFSVGASAIWNISPKKGLSNVSSASCFYGSQIRNNLNVSPIFPVQLIFPSSEKHFSVSELILILSGREGVYIEQANFLHGFMNRHSKNFNRIGYKQYLDLLTNSTFGKQTNNLTRQ